MHSVRRAALRAASCSARVVAVPRQQVASFAVHVSKANVRPAAALPLSRYFSQTARVAQEGEREQGEEAAVEEASQSAGEDEFTSAPSSETPTENERARQEGTTIFVSNMTFDATDAHLREAFTQYGEITSINIGRDGRGLSRGFGFITFTSKDAADDAVRGADKSFWHGRRINVQHRKQSDNSRPARSSGDGLGNPTSSLYIGNIPYETSDADLNAMFKSLGNVTDVRVAVDRTTGWPRGFAHADFVDVESAERAFEKLSTTTLGGRQLRVDYSQPRTSSFEQRGRKDDRKW